MGELKVLQGSADVVVVETEQRPGPLIDADDASARVQDDLRNRAGLECRSAQAFLDAHQWNQPRNATDGVTRLTGVNPALASRSRIGEVGAS
jgi:hypothetical protein